MAGSAALAAVATWFLCEAVRERALATALDAPRWSEVAPFAGGVSLGLLVGFRIRETAALVAIVLAALVAGALAAFVEASVERVALHSFALVALAAAWGRAFPGVGSLVAAALAAGASVLAVPTILAAGPVVAPSLVAGMALLATWFGARVAPVRGPAAFSWVVVAAVVVGVVGWSAPSSWWRGGADGQAALHAVFGAGALWAALGGRRAIALLLAALAASVAFVRAPGEVGGGADGAVLAAGRTMVASYDRATQTMRLATFGEIVAESNAESPVGELAATLVQCLGAPGDRVLVLGSGAMRLPELLSQSGVHEVEVADAGAAAVRAALAADGPVAAGSAEVTARVRRWSAGWPATLAALPAGSRQIVVVSESPTTRAAGFATVAAQHELRRVAGAGLVLQAIAVDHANPDRVRDLLAAAVAVHPWNGVFAVGGAAWLVGAGGPPVWPSEGAWSAASDDRRWIAHRARLGDVGDVQRALLGVVRAPPAAAAGAGAGSTPRAERRLVAVWREWLAPVPAPEAPETGSVLLQWIARTADVRAAVRTIAELGATAADQARAQAIAAGFLHVGAPAAYLQAALGLPDANGVPLLAAERAALCAHALDPTLFAAAPPVFTDLPRPKATRGDLEDLAYLPAGERLAELCSADTALAVALRARFASQCARALVEALARGPLPPEQVQALREIADPFVLAEAARVLVRRAALPELLAIWRADLPMPASLGASARGGVAERRVLAAALGGRRDAASWRTLVDLLVAPEVEVRRAAAASLRASVGDGVAYDPEWSGSALNEAADRLRSLHNRKP